MDRPVNDNGTGSRPKDELNLPPKPKVSLIGQDRQAFLQKWRKATADQQLAMWDDAVKFGVLADISRPDPQADKRERRSGLSENPPTYGRPVQPDSNANDNHPRGIELEDAGRRAAPAPTQTAPSAPSREPAKNRKRESLFDEVTRHQENRSPAEKLRDIQQRPRDRENERELERTPDDPRWD